MMRMTFQSIMNLSRFNVFTVFSKTEIKQGDKEKMPKSPNFDTWQM